MEDEINLVFFSGVDERLQGKDLPQDSVERDRYLAETLQALSNILYTSRTDNCSTQSRINLDY